MGQMQTPRDVIASKSKGFFYSQDAKKKFEKKNQSVDPPKKQCFTMFVKTKNPMIKIESRSEAPNCPS